MSLHDEHHAGEHHAGEHHAGEHHAGEHHAGQHLPADPTKGDERTLGGYMAVHSRPAAFEGVDGVSYSADILTDTTGDPSAPWGAYLFFVRWGRGEPEVQGHVESGFLVKGTSESGVRHALGAMQLATVKATLDGLLRPSGTAARDSET
ncbi:MAG TPA: hypothetical protein VE869_06900 [Gemmatimonas sp.]|nr:hypothetical protein [Gemmatimonas sp.]